MTKINNGYEIHRYTGSALKRRMKFKIFPDGTFYQDYSGYGLPPNEQHVCQFIPCTYLQCPFNKKN
jgi:hypothetical protein